MPHVAFVKRFCKFIFEVNKMTDSNDSQDKTVFIKTRISEKIARDFRIALAVRNESVQDAISKAVLQYIKDTKLPDDMLLK